MTERFPKLQLEDDLDPKLEQRPSAEHASGPQASKKKLPPPLPARRAGEPPVLTAAAEPPKPANKPPAPAARQAAAPVKPAPPLRPAPSPERPPAAHPAEPRPPPPRAAQPAATAPLKTQRPASAEATQRSSPGAYRLPSAPQPIRQSSPTAPTPEHNESPRPGAAPPPPPAADTKPKPDTVPAMPASKASVAPVPSALPQAAAEAPVKPQPGPAIAPETAWFSNLLDAAWTEASPSPAAAPPEASSAIESRDHTVSGVKSVAPEPSKSEATRSEPLESSLCAFWIDKRCFALDVALVGEVVSVDTVVPVPLTPDAFVGLFNLRGTPMALVDLAQVLELEDRAPRPAGEARKTLSALVFRSSRLTAAAVIDKMEAVLPAGRETLTRPESADNPMVQGFVEVRHRPGLVVTVLDPTRVIERLERLKYA